LVVLYVALFAALIYKCKWFKLNVFSVNYVLLFFVLKVAGALAYGLVFEFHYNRQGDSWGYYYQGIVLRELIHTDFSAWLKINFGLARGYGIPEEYKEYFYDAVYWNNSGSNMMVRFTSLASWLAFGKFYVLSVFSAFISFLGCILTVKSVEYLVPQKIKILTILIFLFPSVCFWGSGLHKEPWVILGLGLILYSLFKLNASFSAKKLITLILGVLLLLLFRNYFLFILIPGLIAFGVCKFYPKYSPIKYVAIYLIVIFLGVTVLPKVSNTMNPMALLFIKHSQFQIFKGGANFEATPLKPTLKSFIVNSPKAFYNVFFRPLKKEVRKKMQWLSYAEARFIFLFFLFALFFLSWKKIKDKNLFLLLLFYSASILWTIGMIVPNFGTIARYKSAVLPVILCLIVMAIDDEKVMRILRKIRPSKQIK